MQIHRATPSILLAYRWWKIARCDYSHRVIMVFKLAWLANYFYRLIRRASLSNCDLIRRAGSIFLNIPSIASLLSCYYRRYTEAYRTPLHDGWLSEGQRLYSSLSMWIPLYTHVYGICDIYVHTCPYIYFLIRHVRWRKKLIEIFTEYKNGRSV